MSRGGSVILSVHVERKIARSKIVVLADVSGSMDQQSEEIYLILYLFKNVSANSELFVFSTDLMRLTNLAGFNDFRLSAERISKRVEIWGSGTRIGECFRNFLEKYESLVDRDTVIVIISDGWDLGDPKVLDESMRRLKSLSHRIIWLNPHLKTKGYEPSCVGMKAALPYVDVFAPTEVFASRPSFEEYFGKETSQWVGSKANPVREEIRIPDNA